MAEGGTTQTNTPIIMVTRTYYVCLSDRWAVVVRAQHPCNGDLQAPWRHVFICFPTPCSNLLSKCGWKSHQPVLLMHGVAGALTPSDKQKQKNSCPAASHMHLVFDREQHALRCREARSKTNPQQFYTITTLAHQRSCNILCCTRSSGQSMLRWGGRTAIRCLA